MTDTLNMDYKERDTLVFGRVIDWGNEDMGGCMSYGYTHGKAFPGLTVETLKTLLEKNFADPDEIQNDAPSIQEFVEFMEAHPGFVAHGYVVSPERDDYRVSIEGIHWTKREPMDYDTERAFMTMFRQADEFDLDNGWCWYD